MNIPIFKSHSCIFLFAALFTGCRPAGLRVLNYRDVFDNFPAYQTEQ